MPGVRLRHKSTKWDITAFQQDRHRANTAFLFLSSIYPRFRCKSPCSRCDCAQRTPPRTLGSETACSWDGDVECICRGQGPRNCRDCLSFWLIPCWAGWLAKRCVVRIRARHFINPNNAFHVPKTAQSACVVAHIMVFRHHYLISMVHLTRCFNACPNVKQVYQASTETFLPTPVKSHYLFNMRDVAKVIEGIMQVLRAVNRATTHTVAKGPLHQ